MFCKVFDNEKFGQILVMLDHQEDAYVAKNPDDHVELSIRYNSKSPLGIMRKTIKFDGFHALEKAMTQLKEMYEQEALIHVNEMQKMVDEFYNQ